MNDIVETRVRILIVTTGLSLIAAGCYLIFYVLKELIKISTDIESSLFFTKIKDLLIDKSLFLTSEGFSIVISEGMALITACVFLFFLIWTAVGISFSLINSGKYLLVPEVISDIASIKNKLKVISSNILINKNEDS